MSDAQARRCRICDRVLLVLDHAGDDPICEKCSFDEATDNAAWDDDEADMQRISDEWAAFDREPDGS